VDFRDSRDCWLIEISRQRQLGTYPVPRKPPTQTAYQ
jgi:hypothetical protein